MTNLSHTSLLIYQIVKCDTYVMPKVTLHPNLERDLYGTKMNLYCWNDIKSQQIDYSTPAFGAITCPIHIHNSSNNYLPAILPCAVCVHLWISANIQTNKWFYCRESVLLCIMNSELLGDLYMLTILNLGYLTGNY